MSDPMKPLTPPAWCGMPEGMSLELTCYKDKVKVETVAVKTACFTFGKVQSLVDYLLEHPSISRRHAALMINKDNGKVYLTDLKSSHGVKINGKRITPERPTSVGNGEIRFGAST